MSLFKKVKEAKENKKGFTLVELIVVLVILAILAAIMVPALTKWIDKSKEKQIVIDGRTVYLAAQTVVSEEYAKATSEIAANKTGISVASGTGVGGQIYDLADVEGTYECTVDLKDWKVSKVVFTQGNLTATFENGSWTTSKKN